MQNTLVIDPLDRTCTEVLTNDGQSRDRPDPGAKPVTISVRQLASVPVFVLLGEPGMGKSETMKALADHVEGECITVNDFIVDFGRHQGDARPVLIDALDEARASGDTTVWRELRKGIAQARLARFGVACRSADWYASDREDLATLAKVQTVRVFSLDALSAEQRRKVLVHEGIQEVDTFEQKAQRLGFADMLGNPQLLKLLAAAVRSPQDQRLQTRSEAYALACQEMVKEENQHHQQAQRITTLLSHGTLLDAAGWLCALMLLSNRNAVSDETPDHGLQSNVWLVDVLDVRPENEVPADAVQQVLKRPLFLKPNAYVCAHRTVAEYLAARYIAKRIAKGLLPSRVASLMLASPQHLVRNLRGLAGWLAVLCEPMRASIFEADPAAVLNYGDLYLLPTLTKQALLDQLAIPSRAQTDGNMWQQAPSHLPLVQADMRSFVTQWFAQFQDTVEPSAQQTTVAHILLNALECASAEPQWEAALLGLLRDGRVTDDLHRAALDALQVHASSPAVLLALLQDIQRGDLGDPTGELADRLLQTLYPNHLGPAQVLRFFNPKNHRLTGRIDNTRFWSRHIEKATPDELLPELMATLEQAISDGLFKKETIRAARDDLDGLATLAVKAIETHGASIPVAQLSRWLWMCLDGDTSPFKSLTEQGAPRLAEWLTAHTERIKPVLTCWVHEGTSSWVAQRRFWSIVLPPDMGAFWLRQAQEFAAAQEMARAKDCLETAVRCLINQPDSGITLDDVVATAAMSGELKEALVPMLESSLEKNQWQSEHWLYTKKHREKAAAKKELDDKNLRYLLDHLPDVQSGKLLNYLGETAWVDLKDSGYGDHDADLLAQWRKDHPELDDATRQGYRTLLFQLSTAQANSAIESRTKKSIWHFELPCLVAAQDLYGQEPQQLLQLGQERLQALVTLYLLHHVSSSDWLLALIEVHPSWVEEVWWQLSQKALRSKTEIRIPHLWLLAREPRARSLALRLLPRLLAAWPTKFSEANFSEFAQLLEATVKTCPSALVSELVSQRLQKKSLSSLQRAYLVMAGLWTDPLIFAPMADSLLLKKQIAQSELLGFIGYLRRYGDRNAALPRWNAATMGQLFKLFGPLCPSARPLGVYSPGAKDDGRDFLYQLLAALRTDTGDAAEGMLLRLSTDAGLSDWRAQIEDSLSRQRQAWAEQAFALPNARQVALTLLNKTPANPSDLMAVAWDALGELQKILKNSSTNLKNRLWTVDSAGNRRIPPHRPEPECRNVIADQLSTLLSGMGISVTPEHQHGAQNQSDIVLRVQTLGSPVMLLPIEVKGDWNKDLWTAPYEQLAKKYASDPQCHGKGIYLVLWLGINRGKSVRKLHPNHATHTAAELQERLQQVSDQKARSMDIRVFVLDISI